MEAGQLCNSYTLDRRFEAFRSLRLELPAPFDMPGEPSPEMIRKPTGCRAWGAVDSLGATTFGANDFPGAVTSIAKTRAAGPTALGASFPLVLIPREVARPFRDDVAPLFRNIVAH